MEKVEAWRDREGYLYRTKERAREGEIKAIIQKLCGTPTLDNIAHSWDRIVEEVNKIT